MRVVKHPGNLFGYQRLGFQKDIQYNDLSSEESGVDASKTAKAPGSNTITTQTQAKGPTGRTAKKVVPSVTTDLLVVASSFVKHTSTPGRTHRSSTPTTAQTTASTAKGTLAKAMPTPTSSIVPLLLAQSSALRKMSDAQKSPSSPGKQCLSEGGRKRMRTKLQRKNRLWCEESWQK